jgi:hypothetical protein
LIAAFSAAVEAISLNKREHRMKKIALFGILAGVAGVLTAQETPKFTFSGGAGFSTPVGNTGNNLDTGWNIRAGAGYNLCRGSA